MNALLMAVFRRFETLLPPTARPMPGVPPEKLVAFYWHFVRQAKGLFGMLFVTTLLVAAVDLSIPYFIGQIVGLLSNTPRGEFWPNIWPFLALMAVVLLLLRPTAILLNQMVVNLAIVPPVTNMIRWQTHWYVVRQSWSFFQDDFAGRIANRIMQTGPAIRESMVAGIRAVWYILVMGFGAASLMAVQDLRLAIPVMVWFAGYALLLRFFIPRMRDCSKRTSEARSALTGRIVDSYTNILTVKLFARTRNEDAYVSETINEHTALFHESMRLQTLFVTGLQLLNTTMLMAMVLLSMWLWSVGAIEIGVVAMVLPLTNQILGLSGWVAFEIAGIFENVGIVQEGMLSIAKPWRMVDEQQAKPLKLTQGAVHFEDISFGYRGQRSVIDHVDLAIRPGEKVGLVGRSGAGKSTLVNLLLRFFDVERGRITIDGADIRHITQESLRAAIAVVTQDTSLLHRSIRDNILYGRPDASQAELEAAARKAHAHDFVLGLEDSFGRKAYDAQVGERGVKLSGGQRQRIAIARVILKNSPILVLDEATSALDSEVEAAIQESLQIMMEGRTVIAIAHRLSTLQIMDRLVVLDHGRIIEEGTHAELLAKGGLYAELWSRQSGGFIDAKAGEESEAAE
jgi:ATP-binding cassette, subfamily B, multidrug efflux pump